MKPLMNKITELGANDTTANFILKVLAITIALIVLGIMVIAVLETYRTGTVSPWVATLLGGFGLIITTLLTVNHTTQVTNTTNTKSAIQTVESLKPTLDAVTNNANINAQSVQQVLQAMAQVNQTQANMTAATAIGVTETAKVAAHTMAVQAETNTEATQENTEATQENTQVEEKRLTGNNG